VESLEKEARRENMLCGCSRAGGAELEESNGKLVQASYINERDKEVRIRLL